MTMFPKPVKREKQRKPMNKLGHRSLKWSESRLRLKEAFRKMGITECEFRFEGCWHNTALSFAHAVKRRFLKDDAPKGSPEHIDTVALACGPCHIRLDGEMNHAEMREAIMGAIAGRSILSGTVGED